MNRPAVTAPNARQQPGELPASRRGWRAAARPGAAFHLRALAVLGLVLVLAQPAWRPALAQAEGPAVSIIWVDSRVFPTVAARVTVLDANGLPVLGLAADDFAIIEDGVAIPVDSLAVASDTADDLRLVVAVDLSTDANTLQAVQAALGAFLDTLSPRDQVALIGYHNEATVDQDLTSDTAQLKAAVDAWTARQNSTAFNAAAVSAVDLASTLPPGRNVVVLLTDSGDNLGRLADADVVARAQEAGIPIYIIAYGSRLKTDPLRAIASGTGGQATFLASPDFLADPLQTLRVVLRQGYRLTYRSSLEGDSAEHEMQVTVQYRDQAGEAQASFVAAPGAVTVSGPGIEPGQSVIGMVYLVTRVTAPEPVQSVEYLLDGQPLARVFTPPAFSLNWNSAMAGAGRHTLTVKAVDDAGHEGQAQVEFTVILPSPLTISLTSAETGYELGEVVTLQAQADTPGEVSQVDFWLDGKLLGRDDIPPYELAFNSGDFTAGEHVAIARAEDSLGQRAEAAFNLQFSSPPRQNWLKIALSVVLIAAVVVITVASLRLMAGMIGAQKRGLQRTCRLQISNQGNARARYELKADDPTGALRFQFLLNGVDLSEPPTETAPAAQPSASRAMVVRSAAPEPEEPRPPSGLKAWGGRMYAAVGIFANLLNTVGYLLGSRGSQAMQAGASVRQAQITTDRAKDVSRESSALRQTLGPGKQRADQGQAAAPEAAASSQRAATPAVQLPGDRPRAPVTPQTPSLEPGETLTLQLVIDPPRAQQYTFRVVSQVMGQPGLAPVIDQRNIRIALPPWYRRFAPWLVFVPLALIVVWSIQFLLTLFGVAI